MAKKSLLYIATQDPAKMGITVAEFDSDTGALSPPKLIMETRDPAHFTLSADGKRLYMCNTGTPGGVSAFAVRDKKTGALELLNYKESKGRGPSYVSVDQTGHYVFDANYGGGYFEIYSLAADGSLDRQTAFVQHEGSSVHARQDKPYAHWIRTDPTNRFALVADLGMDKIMIYRFDATTGKVTPNDPPFAKLTGGSGPRHLAFHPNGRWLYAVQELSNEVVAFKWDAQKGELTQFQQVKTLPADFTAQSTAAEIAIRRDGKFLYTSNRGHGQPRGVFHRCAEWRTHAATTRAITRQGAALLHVRPHRKVAGRQQPGRWQRGGVFGGREQRRAESGWRAGGVGPADGRGVSCTNKVQ
jgi:6-phosphogluconolactonase